MRPHKRGRPPRSGHPVAALCSGCYEKRASVEWRPDVAAPLCRVCYGNARRVARVLGDASPLPCAVDVEPVEPAEEVV